MGNGRHSEVPWNVTHVNVHPTIRAIKDAVFHLRLELIIVNLEKGLGEIRVNAFHECTSLHEIFIPPTVEAIKEAAFFGCSDMMTVADDDCDSWRRAGGDREGCITKMHISK